MTRSQFLSIALINFFKPSNGRKDIIEVFDPILNENILFKRVIKFTDGSLMDSSKCDDVIYKKVKDSFFKRLYHGPVNVKWFGAKGDGFNDDAPAINKCIQTISKMGGGHIFIDKGIYLIKRPLHLDHFNSETYSYDTPTLPVYNLKISGYSMSSTTIKAEGFWTSAFTTFPDPYLSIKEIPLEKSAPILAKKISITDLTIDMDYNKNPDGGAMFGANYDIHKSSYPNGYQGKSYFAADNYQHAIYLNRVKYFDIQRVNIKNCWYNGISIYWCEQGLIKDCLISNCGDKKNYLGFYAAFEVDATSQDISFTNNICKNIGNGVVANGDALSYSHRPVRNLKIDKNIFEKIKDNGMLIFGWLENWKITENFFKEINHNGILVNGNGFTIVAGRHPRAIVIDKNIITNYGLSGHPAIGIRANCISSSISNNTINQQFKSKSNILGIVVTNESLKISKDEKNTVKITYNQLKGSFIGESEYNGIISVDMDNATISNNLINTFEGAGSHILIIGDNFNLSQNKTKGVFKGKSAITILKKK